MTVRIKAYCVKFQSLSFLEKHTVVSGLATIALSAAGLLLSFMLLRVTSYLQRQANFVQMRQFRIVENERNARRLQESVRAFALDSSHGEQNARADGDGLQ